MHFAQKKVTQHQGWMDWWETKVKMCVCKKDALKLKTSIFFLLPLEEMFFVAFMGEVIVETGLYKDLTAELFCIAVSALGVASNCISTSPKINTIQLNYFHNPVKPAQQYVCSVSSLRTKWDFHFLFECTLHLSHVK